MRLHNWSQSDLARASGLTRQSISYYISDRSKQPDEFALQKIAKAFKLPLEEVYRAAGILPPKPNSDPLTEEGLYILQQLEGENKKDALRYLRMRLQVAQEQGTYNAEPKAGPAAPK